MKRGFARPALPTVKAGLTPQVKRIIPELPERTGAALGVRFVQVVVRDANGETLNVGSTPETRTSKQRRSKITLCL